MVLATFAETKVDRLPGRNPASHLQLNHSQWRRVAFSGIECLPRLGLETPYFSTENEVYRKLAINHIVTHMNIPDDWRHDYPQHAHSVP